MKAAVFDASSSWWLIWLLCLSPVCAEPETKEYATAMPLPTYEQSEKYEKEGVLDYHNLVEKDDEDDDDEEEEMYQGTCCDFMVFFISEVPSQLEALGGICRLLTVLLMGHWQRQLFS